MTQRSNLGSSRLAPAALTITTAVIATFLVVPLVVLVVGQVQWSDISRVIARAATWRVVWFSTWQAVLSVAATFVIAMPVTWLIGRHEFRGRRVLRAICTVGFLLPSVVVGAAFLAVLPRSLHYSVLAVVLAHAYFNVAVVVRVVGARLETFDPRLSQAAYVLGATPLRAITTLAWPLSRGAVMSASGVVFLYCFTSYAVVRVLGGPTRNTMESDIALRAFGIGDVSGATVLACMQVVIIVLVVASLQRSAGREATHLRLSTIRITSLPSSKRPVAIAVAVAMTLFVMVPLASVFWRSVRVGDSFSLAAWRATFGRTLVDAVAASTRIALLTGLLGVLLAALASLGIVRARVGGQVLDAISVVPLALSPVTLGLGLIVTFDSSWYDWRADWWFVAVAHTLVAFPLVTRVLVPAWRAIPRRLSDAAAVLGAGELRRFVDVDLRILHRALVAGLGLAVAVSLGEFGAATLLSRRGAETMPVTIARLLERTGDAVRAQAFALSSLLIVFCIAALLAVESALGKGPHAERH